MDVDNNVIKCPSCVRRGEEGINISFLKICNGFGPGKGIAFECNSCPAHSNNGVERKPSFTIENTREFKADELRQAYP